MSAQKIRTALGQLQDDPEQAGAWTDLSEAVPSQSELSTAELGALLSSARRGHEHRREWDAVARLLELAVGLARGTDDEARLQGELARVEDEETLDDKAAVAAYRRLLELRPDDPAAAEALGRIDAKREKSKELVKRYLKEVEEATEPAFKSSLLLSAAEVAWRYGGRKKKALEQMCSMLEQSLGHDPTNRRAAGLLERIHRTQEDWEAAAAVLSRYADDARDRDERIAALVRLGRMFALRMKDAGRAATAYERVSDLSPGHHEAMSFLARHFSEKEDWDHLVALYEDQLQSGAVKPGQELGTLVQIAMTHWRMRQRPDSAEPWFERVRRLDPTHEGMLSFFRELCGARDQKSRLSNILSDAQRALPDGPQRAALAGEIARLAEDDANAGRAIEQYKAILRQDPHNREARDSLRRLYTQTEAWNALVELLRQELERAPADDKAARLAVLRDIAAIYRTHIKSDTALVTVLTQIVGLDDQDEAAIRDLVRVYEALSRWRDLVTYQQRLAELLTDPADKARLYREIAARWLDQFNNVANAIDSYEKLLEVAPTDAEAQARLRELYGKRRAWPQLFALAEKELPSATGQGRVDLLLEMAKLAGERLDRGEDAVRFYREALTLEPGAPGAMDALEKQAEREKDWATAAWVLERRVDAAPDDAARLTLLQKLGALFTERLGDAAGAARTWRRVLELSPGHAKALRTLRDAHLASGDLDALEELYAPGNDWESLAEVLSSAADRATDVEQKIALSRRSARVFEEKLQAPDRAFRAYERVLGVKPDDEGAARALVPIYEREERWARLVPILEIVLASEPTPAAQVATLRRMSQVTGQRLGDRAGAMALAERAYRLTPEDPESLQFFEATAREAGAYDALIAALSRRLEEARATMAREERRAVEARLAELKLTQQGKIDDAVALYRALVEEDPSDAATVAMLDGLLRRADRRDDLRWLFGLKVERAEGDARAAVYAEWAELEDEAFGEPARAIDLYEKVVEARPDHPSALAALSRLHLAAGDSAKAVALLQRRRELAVGDDRAHRDLDLAEQYVDKLGAPTEALVCVSAALELLPGDARAIALLERVATHDATRAAATELLSREYARSGDAKKEAESIAKLLDGTTDPARRLELFSRLADAHEQKLAAPRPALEVLLRGAREFPAELGLWDRATDLAQVTGSAAALGDALREALATELPEQTELELAERAAVVFDERLGNPEAALPYLDLVLQKRPEDERAFSRMKQVLTSTEKWQTLEELYERVAAAAPDDARRVELFAEVALVCEEITQQPAKAITYYERILAIDPLHEQAVRSLDSLYQAEKRPRDLAALLERRREAATEDEAQGLRLRLGRLYLELEQPEGALAHLAEVLSIDPMVDEARDLVERVLGVDALRPRAAAALEACYEVRDDARNLVRVLAVLLESAENSDRKRELLRRIASLRDERLHDDAGSFDALAALLPMAPDDDESRARLVDTGRRLGAYARVAEVLSAAADAADLKTRKAELLLEVARLYEDFLSDGAKAEAVLDRVVAIDPDDAELALPAARALERLHLASGDTSKLASSLKLQVKLEGDADKRRELWGRLGELAETVQADRDGAIAAWQARLADDPSDEQALAALERLHDAAGAWKELVQVLRAHEQVSQDPVERRRLLVKTAETLGAKLGDTTEAVLAYRTVVDEFGPDPSLLVALAGLYAKSGAHHDLAETLALQLDVAEDEAARVELLVALGDVRRAHLEDLSGALDAYRQALTLAPSHAAARESLEALLQSADVRREVAETLHPLYEADGAFEKLLAVLSIEIECADTPSERLALLDQAERTAAGPLADRARAFSFALAGLKEAAGEPSLAAWLERAEQLAAATARYGELVEGLKAIAPEVLDEELSVRVRVRLAEISRDHLGNLADARDWFKEAVALRGDDPQLLASLAAVYEQMGDLPALLETTRRRVDAATDDDARRALYFRQATLTREVEGPREAISVYEAILDLGLDPAALAALEELYAKEARWDDLVALFERQISEGVGDKASLRVKLAGIAEHQQGDVERAFDELVAALEIDPSHDGAAATLEGLMSPERAVEVRARAAELLEPVYLRRAEWQKVVGCVDARLAASQDPEERKGLLRRLIQLREESGDDARAALEVAARLLAEDLSDESAWAECERLARVTGASGRLAEIYEAELEKIAADEEHTAKLARRTGELSLAAERFDKALAYFRRALAFEPESRELFSEVDALLVRAGDHAARVALYRATLDHRTDDADRLKLLHAIAELEEGPLEQQERAIDTHREALDVDERDVTSLDALTRLYRATKRYQDLAAHYERRVETSGDGDEVAALRLALAKLYADELGDTSAAIDQLQTIVEALPWHRDAIAELERLSRDPEHKARVVEILLPLYERSDDWRDLVRINERRLELADGAGEKVGILREIAKLQETRGADPKAAFEALERCLVLDPETDARADLERLASSLSSWDALAGTYEQAIEKAEDHVKRELLLALARLHDQRRDDPRAALNAFTRLAALDETDPEPLEQMDLLAMMLSDWSAIVRVLEKKIALATEDDARAALYRRIGESKRDMLDDADGAIAAYERAAELEPDSAYTIDCLIELVEGKDDPARLVELCRRRVELAGADDADLKYELSRRIAGALEAKLGRRRDAIDALREALAARPADQEVLAELDRVLSAEELWPDLLDNLRLQAASAEAPAERVRLRRAMGDLYREKLDEPTEALECYRQVLEDEPSDPGAVAACFGIADGRDEHRAAAVDVLEPVLRLSGRFPELVRALELKLRSQGDAQSRAQTLRTLAITHELNLAAPAAALDALLRALVEAPDDDTVHAEAERLSDELGDFTKYATALEERAAAVFDAEITRGLRTRLGRVAETRLSDDARAIAAFRAALDDGGDAPELLLSLDRLYGRAGDDKGLAEILERRIGLDDDADARADLHHRLAELQISRFADPAAGVASLRAALESRQAHVGAREALERLLDRESLFAEVSDILEQTYRALGDHGRLASLLGRRIDRAPVPADRVKMRLDLARVLEEDAKDLAAAQGAIEAAMMDDPTDPDVLAEVERVAPIHGGWASAAAALSRAVAKKELPRDTARELLMRVGDWQRNKVGDRAAAEQAYEEALARDPESLDIVRLLEELRRAPGRDRALVDTLRLRAKLESERDTRRSLLREARALAADPLADAALAEAILRQLLEDADADQGALEELGALRAAAGDHADVVRLLLKRAELTTEATERARLKHDAAATYREQLHDKDRATKLYEEIVEESAEDARAVD
ncbi:MAG: tetratricopeptide repeat protein, partial [Polyangiaceae bacterium]|nr:tetratricopeptide repeat protein [Polyangiaceae bacterium]